MKTKDTPPPAGPLSGVRVIEFGGIGPGPFCGMLLADMGADVTLLERPEGTLAAQLFGGGRKTVANRGKKSLAINLKHPDAKAMAMRLIGDADVLIEGFRPGVMERLGFGPEECLAANPRLVYGRMTGWGQTGPLAARAGHDANYAAIAGALDAGRHHGGAPWAPPTLVGDMGGGGLLLAWGIACALIEVGRSGKGQVVDAAMCEGSALLAHGLFNLQALGQWPARWGQDWKPETVLDSGAPFYDVYPCADGGWISVCPLEPQFYAEFVKRLGFAGDPDFAGEQYDTSRWPARRAKLEALFAAQPRAHWEVVFDDTDDCVWPVLSLAEAPQHPHNVAREAFVEVAGVVQPAPAPRLSRTAPAVGGLPPKVGEQTRERLTAFGFTAAEIEALLQNGAVVSLSD
jgi:alpha-methylacyl-CoA racemase